VLAGAPCAWPGAADPRVLVVEVESGGALEALATEIDVALRACGVATGRRPFRAHITLARVDAGAPAEIDLSGLPPAGEIELDRLALVDSAPRADGTRYREVAGFALRGG
jgi:2'-5' RNA ligase